MTSVEACAIRPEAMSCIDPGGLAGRQGGRTYSPSKLEMADAACIQYLQEYQGVGVMQSAVENRSVWYSGLDKSKMIPLGIDRIGKMEESDSQKNNSTDMIVVIENRVLIRDCISKSIAQIVGEDNVHACSDIDQWLLEKKKYSRPTLILFCIGRRGRLDDETLDKFTRIGDEDLLSRVVLMSDGEDADGILDALEQGVRGYIPTSVSLEVAIEAMRLVRAGGIYVPASSMIAARSFPGGGQKTGGQTKRVDGSDIQQAKQGRKRSGTGKRSICRILQRCICLCR